MMGSLAPLIQRTLIWGASFGGPLMPHGFCLIVSPWLIVGMFFGNLAITAAYLSISADLRWVMRRSPKLADSAELFGFQRFIKACGWTHAMHAVTLFVAFYYWELGILVLTAWVSLSTASLIRRERAEIVAAIGGGHG